MYNTIKNKILFIINSRYKVAKVTSIRNYSRLRNIKYRLLSQNRKTTVYPIHFFNQTPKEPINASLFDIYYSVIENCNIIGQSNAILTKDNYLLYDYLAHKSLKKINVTDSGLFLLLNRVIHLGKIFFINYLKVSKNAIDKGIMLSGNFTDNYYHFVLEFLVKFELISQANIDYSIPIVLDNRVKKILQFNELITIFNIGNREIIYVEPRVLYTVNELHYVSAPNKIPPNIKGKIQSIKSEDYAFDFNSIDFLRTTIRRYFDSIDADTPRKIFISRANCIKRKNNEADLYPILKRFGYTIIHPENMTFKEQFICFANADYIIAASGAALTNIVFCKPECNILVFQTVQADITIFSSIAKYLNTNMMYITGSNETTKLHPDFIVPVNLLEEYLQKYDDLTDVN